MSDPTVQDVARSLNAAASRVGESKVQPIAGAFGRGYVAAVQGLKASVRKGTIDVEPTPGFDVPAFLQLAPGDLVWYYELGSDRLVVAPLERNAVLPQDVTLHNLTLTGRLLRQGVITPPVQTSHLDDAAFDGGADAYFWRLDSDGDYELRGVQAEDAGAEHVLINISTHSRTLKNENGATPAADRILTPSGLNYVLGPNAAARIWRDGDSARWRILGT